MRRLSRACVFIFLLPALLVLWALFVIFPSVFWQLCLHNYLCYRVAYLILCFRSRALSKIYKISNRIDDKAISPEVCGASALIAWDTFFTFHDQYCEDVVNLHHDPWPLPKNGRNWWLSHWCRRYPCHNVTHEELSYDIDIKGNEIQFKSKAEPETWINIVSKQKLPSNYIVEFDYTPYTEFEEQLQIAFCAESLAERRRYMLAHNRVLRYQIIPAGIQTIVDIARLPFSLPLGKVSHVKFVLMNHSFSLFVNDRCVISTNDFLFKSRSEKLLLIFYNGATNDVMHFSMADFRITSL